MTSPPTGRQGCFHRERRVRAVKQNSAPRARASRSSSTSTGVVKGLEEPGRKKNTRTCL